MSATTTIEELGEEGIIALIARACPTAGPGMVVGIDNRKGNRQRDAHGGYRDRACPSGHGVSSNPGARQASSGTDGSLRALR